MHKKSLSQLLIFILIATMFVTGNGSALASDYTDTNTHWAKTSIDKWSANGLFQGDNGLFRPDNYISRGEMAVIIDRIMDYQDSAENTFSDLDNNLWYTDAILKANQAGVIEGSNNLIRPDDYITRQEAVVMLSRAFGINPVGENTIFSDDSAISNWAKGYVKAFYNEGLINGFPSGLFAPVDYITRASVVKIIDNSLAEWITMAAAITTDFNGIVVINTPDVTLKDLQIDGDLIIAEGVGDGEIHMDNVTITGNVRVRGGGINSIYFNDCLISGELTVNKTGGQIRIVASGTTSVTITTLASGAIVVEQNLEGGGFESITIPKEIAEKSSIILDGNFEDVKIDADKITITILEHSIVDTLTNNGDAIVITEESTTPSSSDVTINPESIQISPIGNIRVDDEIILSATILPANTTNKTIVWSISDDSIASIDQTGTLTGITPGNVDITGTCSGSVIFDSISIEIVEKTAVTGIIGLNTADDPSDITHTILTSPVTVNRFVYKINSDGSAFSTPFVMDTIAGYTEITDTSTILETTDGFYIGIYELNTDDKVLNFTQVQAMVKNHSITNGELNYIEDLCVIGLSSEDAATLGYDQSYSLTRNYNLMVNLDFANRNDYRNPSANMDNLSGWDYEDIDSITGISSEKSTINLDGFTPIGEYSGTFNGNYNTIDHLY
ncbi:MAG: S-layer homology domain-containing protein, partial [Vallitaleaceae bacterium]|nr:S-layer homology domain-containing protein [Vallitaleaceae bacterium]